MPEVDLYSDTAAITVTLGGTDSDDVRVIELTGHEGLNELFDYSIQLSARTTEIDLDTVLKSPCTIEIAAGESTRYIHGIVQSFERLGESAHHTYYVARIVPQHWVLTKRYGSRIFQEHNCPDMTVAGIIRKVLLDACIPADMFRFVLTRDLPARDYVVQYRETEFDFISRLMEDEGLACYFEHTDTRHVLVIGETPAVFGNDSIYDSVTYCAPDGMDIASECVYGIRERRSVEYGAVGLTDYNFRRPVLDLRTRYPGGSLPSNRYSSRPPPPPAPPYTPNSSPYEASEYGEGSPAYGDGSPAYGESPSDPYSNEPSPPSYGGGPSTPAEPGYGGYASQPPPSSYNGNSSPGGSGYAGGSGYGGGSPPANPGYNGGYAPPPARPGYNGYGSRSGGSSYTEPTSEYAGESSDRYPTGSSNRDGTDYGRAYKDPAPYGGSMPGGCYPNTRPPTYNRYPAPPKPPAPPPSQPYVPQPPAPPVDYGCAEVRVDYPGGYSERSEGQRRVQIQLEQHQCGVRIFDMRANVRGLTAGYRFTLEYHPLDAFNGEFLVTELVLHAKQSQSLAEDADYAGGFRFEAHIRAIPADVVYRPSCRAPRPFVHGAQTALVVGPATDEIYTDAYGRVKVQFHWDPEGLYDENSSCWIRVSHGMAGGQYGMMFLPRVGQEVIVDFLEGNPDRPIITGRVYNGDCMPPYKLPDYKTRSCIRTSSTPGGYGANEIRFEDKQYYEHLLLYAQRDFHLRSRASCYQAVGGESHVHVYGDCFEKRDKNVSSEVCLDLAQKVGGNQSLTVMGQLHESIYGKHSESCSEYALKAKNGEVVIEAATGITLKVGGNFIKIDEAGIHVMGTVINLNSGGSAGIGYWRKPELPRKPKAAYGTEYGQDVQYHCTPGAPPENGYLTPPSRPDEPEKPDKPTSWIEIELVDECGQPWPGEPYLIVCPDGSEVRGTLDAKGQAHVAVKTDGACEIRFPKLDMAAWERC